MRATNTVRARLRAVPQIRSAVVTARHAGTRPSDVYLASYPKSGNTWVRFVLADLLAGRDTNFADVEAVVPVVGRHRKATPLFPGNGRLIKTHEPYRNSYQRAIYIVRDPRDVALSYRRWLAAFGIEYPSLTDYLRQFVAGRVGEYGSWRDHVLGWTPHVTGESGIVILYEDLKSDAVTEFSKMMHFVGRDESDTDIADALQRNSPATMRAKEEESREYFQALGWKDERVSFVGRASSGRWRNELTEEQQQLFTPFVDAYETLRP